MLKFEKSSYKGSYDEDLSIEGIILEGYNDKVVLQLSGGTALFFKHYKNKPYFIIIY